MTSSRDTDELFLILDGEVHMIDMWNGRAQAVIDAGAPVEIVWNGGMLSKSYYVVARGTPRDPEPYPRAAAANCSGVIPKHRLKWLVSAL